MMRESLKTLLQGALINNTFTLSSVEKTLRETLDSSFSYLYRLQRSLIDYDEFHFKTKQDITKLSSGDMYLDEMGRVCITFDYDLINMNSRDKFRNSKFFMSEFTQQDIQNNQDIFSRSIILIIDNQVLFDFKIRMDNGMTTLILPFKYSYVINTDLSYRDHNTTILAIPNTYFVRYVTNKGSLKNQSPSKNEVTYIKRSLIKLDEPVGKGVYFAFVQKQGDQFSSSFQEVEVTDDGYFHFLFSNNILDTILNSTGNLIITIIFFKDMHRHLVYEGNPIVVDPYGTGEMETNLLVIQRKEMTPYAMPVATENILVLKQINNDWCPTYTTRVNLYYPNIYQIIDTDMKPGDQYRLYYFYKKNYVLKYTSMFDFYHRYLSRVLKMGLEKIMNLIYFEQIDDLEIENKEGFVDTFKTSLKYKWYNHEYDLIDYVVDNSEEKTPPEYKVKRLREFIKDDPECLRTYVLNQNMISDIYYLYVKDINLSLRYRIDTTIETDKKIYFTNEPTYVFAFQNSDTSKEFQCRIFIDGNLCTDYTDIPYMGVDYLYIPASQITETSYIEVEIFHSCIHGDNIYFPDKTTAATITISDRLEISPTLQDICMIDEETGGEYNISQFRFSKVESFEGEEIECPINNEDDSFIVDYSSIPTILRIYANDDAVLHRHIKFDIWKNPYLIKKTVERTSYPCVYLSNYNFKCDRDYIKVYRSDGRLISGNMYKINTNFNSTRIQMLFQMNKGESIIIDISPYRSKLIYYAEKIEKYTEDAFIIDLVGIINKPFDVRYYDVYSNGRKLSEVNIHRISSTKIALTNLTSSSRLEIYEKDRDWEYFGLDYTEHKFYFTPDDLLEKDFVTDEEKQDIIDDIIDKTKDPSADIEKNTDEEDDVEIPLPIESILTFKIFYYEELLPKRLANPDIVQFNKEYLYSEYKDIAETYLVSNESSTSNSGTNLAQYDILLLNPDIIMKGETDDEMVVYLTGDYDSLLEND